MSSLRHSVNAINRYGKYIIAFRTAACLHYNVPNGRMLRTNVMNELNGRILRMFTLLRYDKFTVAY